MLMQTMAEEWIEEGKTIGLREGEKRGEIKVLRRMILQILQRRFPNNELTWRLFEQQLAWVNNEDALQELADSAWEVKGLSDFLLRLQPFLPPAHQGKS